MDAAPRGAAAPRAARLAEELREARTVAVVRLGSIGDVVATLPVAWLLRDLLGPERRLVWVAHPGPAQVLRNVGAVHRVVPLPRVPALRAFRAWRQLLVEARIDAAIDLHGNLRSGLVTWLTRAPIRVGLHPRDCRESINSLFVNRRLPPLSSGNKTRRALEIARLLGHPSPEVRFGLEFDAAERARAREVLGDWLGGPRPVVLLQLGRPGDIRAWPAEHFASLARKLASRDHRVVVLGGPDEKETGKEFLGHLGEPGESIRTEVGTLALREVGALATVLAEDRPEAHALVGFDTGVFHLAAACGLRTIGVYGPQTPERTAPVTPRVTAIYHPEIAPCIPCGRRECDAADPLVCMRAVRPGEVLSAMGCSGPAGPAPGERPPEAEGEISPPQAPTRPRREGLWRAAQTLAVLLALLALGLAGGLGMRPVGWIDGVSRSVSGEAITASIAGAILVAATSAFGSRIGGSRSGLLAGALLGASWGFLRAFSANGGTGAAISLSFGSIAPLWYAESLRVMRSGGWEPVTALLAGAVVAAAGGGLPASVLVLLAAILYHLAERTPRALVRPRFILGLAATAGALAIFGASLESLELDPGEELLAAWLGGGPKPVPWSGALLDTLPLGVLLLAALPAHLGNRRYREDLGFADRRWRLPKVALLAAVIVAVLFPAARGNAAIAALPHAALIVAARIERLLERR